MRNLAFRTSLVMIATMPWESILSIPGFGNASRLMGILVVVVWVASVLASGQVRQPTRFHVVAGFFIVLNAVSVFWSMDVSSTLARASTYVQLMGLVIILWDLFRTSAEIRAGLQAYVIGLYVPLFSTIQNFINGNPYCFNRYSAGDDVPNNTAVLVALGIPLAWHLGACADRTPARTALRIVNYLFIPIAAFVLCLTGTRFAMVMAVPTFLFGLVTLARLPATVRWATFIVITGGLFALPMIVPAESAQRLATLDDELVHGDLTGRTGYWKFGLQMWLARPMLGNGCATFPIAVAAVVGRPVSAHNSFIAILAELGLLGMAAVAAMLGLAACHATQQPKWESLLWLTVGLVWLLGNMVLNWMHTQPTWLLLSLLASSAHAAACDDHETAH